MVAASVEIPATVPGPAGPATDPRRVVTPLDPIRVEELLSKYGLLGAWSHIIVGLCKGFDVGIREQLSRSYIFRQSQFLSIRSRVHYFIYSQ